MRKRPTYRERSLQHTWIRSGVGFFCAVCGCKKLTFKGKPSFTQNGFTSPVNPDCTKKEHMLSHLKAGNAAIADYLKLEQNHLLEYVIKGKSYNPSGMKFHSKIEWIWPVSKQVVEELRKIPKNIMDRAWVEDNTNLQPWLLIMSAASTFEVEELFLATVGGINQLKIFHYRIQNSERSVATGAP